MENRSNLQICLKYLLENLPTNITSSKDLSIGSIFVKAGIPPQYRTHILLYLKDTDRYLQTGKAAGTSYRFIPDTDLDDIVEELIENVNFPQKCNWSIQKAEPIVEKPREEKKTEDRSPQRLVPLDTPLDVMIGQKIYCIYGSEIVVGTLTGINGYYHNQTVYKDKGVIKVPMFRVLYSVLVWDDTLEDKLVTLSLSKEQVGITLENLITKLTEKLK